MFVPACHLPHVFNCIQHGMRNLPRSGMPCVARPDNAIASPKGRCRKGGSCCWDMGAGVASAAVAAAADVEAPVSAVGQDG